MLACVRVGNKFPHVAVDATCLVMWKDLVRKNVLSNIDLAYIQHCLLAKHQPPHYCAFLWDTPSSDPNYCSNAALCHAGEHLNATSAKACA